jgi:hypothetical protein
VVQTWKSIHGIVDLLDCSGGATESTTMQIPKVERRFTQLLYQDRIIMHWNMYLWRIFQNITLHGREITTFNPS